MPESALMLDTCIVSYIMKDSELGRLYAPTLRDKLLILSFITVGELYFGAEKAAWGEKKRLQLEATLRKFVVVPYDHEIARWYGRIVAERERKGLPILPNDAWIAACAARHDVQLVTHNIKDFRSIDSVKIISHGGFAG